VVRGAWWALFFGASVHVHVSDVISVPVSAPVCSSVSARVDVDEEDDEVWGDWGGEMSVEEEGQAALAIAQVFGEFSARR
jgi:hypothetical protein